LTRINSFQAAQEFTAAKQFAPNSSLPRTRHPTKDFFQVFAE
jgi:hypothetical protein